MELYFTLLHNATCTVDREKMSDLVKDYNLIVRVNTVEAYVLLCQRFMGGCWVQIFTFQ